MSAVKRKQNNMPTLLRTITNLLVDTYITDYYTTYYTPLAVQNHPLEALRFAHLCGHDAYRYGFHFVTIGPIASAVYLENLALASLEVVCHGTLFAA